MFKAPSTGLVPSRAQQVVVVVMRSAVNLLF